MASARPRPSAYLPLQPRFNADCLQCAFLVRCSAKKNCLNSLFAFMIRDCLSEMSYKAQLAGLNYTLQPLRNCLGFKIRGCAPFFTISLLLIAPSIALLETCV